LHFSSPLALKAKLEFPRTESQAADSSCSQPQ
jgi:hypothetical protein